MGQAFASAGGGQGSLSQLLATCGVVRRLQDHVQRADDHGQKVVEVVGDAAGQPPDRFHALGVHQVGLGLGLLGEGLADALLEQFVDALEVFLGLLGVGDVEAGADITLEGAGRVEAWHALRAQPALAEGRMLDPHHGLELVPGIEGAEEGQGEDLDVIGVDEAYPAIVADLIRVDVEEGLVAFVGEDDAGAFVGHPDEGGRAVGNGAETGFGLGQQSLCLTCVGDVEGHADEADDLSAGAEARAGEGLDPAIFAVVVLVAGLKRERLTGSFAGDRLLHQAVLIVGMDVGAPVGGAHGLVVAAHEGDVGLVDEGALAILLGHPDQHRGGVGYSAETGLALGHFGLGARAFDLDPCPLGDVVDQAQFVCGPDARLDRRNVQEGA